MQDVINKLSTEQALEVLKRLSETGGKIQEAVLAEARNVLSEIDLHETARKRGTPRDNASAGRCPTQARYTVKQGQYLAFIYYYTKIHGRSPSEADMQSFFGTSPPAIHQMVLSLERLGFIERTPGRARSLKLLLNREQLPDL